MNSAFLSRLRCKGIADIPRPKTTSLLMRECFGCLVCLTVLMTMSCISAFPNNQDLHLDLQTGIVINRTVILRCTGVKSNQKSWYLYKGDTLLIDDGSVNSEYSLYEIYTNQTIHTIDIKFKRFSQDLLDVYKCVREKGPSSNSLDLNDVYKRESEHAEVKCKNTTADRGGRFVNLQCTISLHGITCASQIYWENGNTGEKINTTGGLFKVSCEGGVNDSSITTSLNINTVTDEVIRMNFTMVYVNRYQTTQRFLVYTKFNQDLATQKSKKIVLLISIVSPIAILIVIILTVMLIKKNRRIRDLLACLGTRDCPADQQPEAYPLKPNIESYNSA